MPTSPYFFGSEKLPSVSEILSYDPTGQEIIVWDKRKKKYDKEHGKGAWDSMVTASQNRGTNLHFKAIEQVLVGGLSPHDVYCPEFLADGEPNDEYQYWEGSNRNGLKYWLLNVVDKPYKIIAAEEPFIHSELKFGGTPDIVIEWEGQCWVWDLKTFKGWERVSNVSRAKMQQILDRLGLEELNKDQKYRYYTSDVYFCTEEEKWKITNNTDQYPQYRYKKRNEKRPSYRGWDWYGDKLKKAYMQCLLYRELLQHNGIPIHNIRVISASRKAGVGEFTFFDRRLLTNQQRMIELYESAHNEVMKKLSSYHDQSVLTIESVA